MKLFEIPVYAFTRDGLDERVLRKKESLKASSFTGRSVDRAHIEKVLEFAVSLFKEWDYNYIVGYIVVIKEQKEIELCLYFPNPEIHRFRWYSKRKHYLRKTEDNGLHFYIGNIRKGEELKKRIEESVYGVANDLKAKKGYFVDLETFNNLAPLIDYDILLTMY